MQGGLPNGPEAHRVDKHTGSRAVCVLRAELMCDGTEVAHQFGRCLAFE